MDREQAILYIKENFSYNEEVMNELLQDVDADRRKWCFYEFYEFVCSKKRFINNINYKRSKIGETILIDSPGWKYDGQLVVVEKKRFGRVECYVPTNPGVTLKIGCGAVRFVPQEKKERIKVSVGDLVIIEENRFRPRYDEGDVFKVVWKGAKYVRVVPRNPRHKIHVDVSRADNRPGDTIREYAGENSIYRESVYSLDIPIEKLQPAKAYYGEEMGGLLGDLDSIGL